MIIIGLPKYTINENFFKDSEEFWYFTGFIAADGYVNDELIELALNKKDKYILERFQLMICPDKPLYEKKSVNAWKLVVSSKSIARQFKAIFRMTTNKKKDEMSFPNVPVNYLKDFIRGIIDGNGCIDTTKTYKKFNGYEKSYTGVRLRILGSYKFLSELNSITKLFVKHNTNAINKKGKENIYVVTYNFRTAEQILNWCYMDNKICLERKVYNFKEAIKSKHEEILYSHVETQTLN